MNVLAKTAPHTTITWAGAGGQFSIIAGPAENKHNKTGLLSRGISQPATAQLRQHIDDLAEAQQPRQTTLRKPGLVQQNACAQAQGLDDVGRGPLYGLGAGGQAGVERMFESESPPFANNFRFILATCRLDRCKQLDPVPAVRDYQSDMAVFSRKGSKAVKEARQQRERQKQAQQATSQATGYYNYDTPLQAKIPGLENFSGPGSLSRGKNSAQWKQGLVRSASRQTPSAWATTASSQRGVMRRQSRYQSGMP
ncbi:hypothetical protein MY1884_008709, partial [Beauveria asiatica]